MLYYTNIFEMYPTVKVKKVNTQIVNLIINGFGDTIPTTTVLGQFKYCINNNIKDWRYNAIRSYLVTKTSEDIITILEG